MSSSIEAYTNLQKSLLNLEREAEREENLEAIDGSSLSALQSAGLALTHLNICSTATDPTARHVISLRPRAPGRTISASRISTGDIVALRRHSSSSPTPIVVEGVVVAQDDVSISVCVDEHFPDYSDDNVPVAVLKLSPDVTHRRYTTALSALESVWHDPAHVAHNLLRVLLHGRAPRFNTSIFPLPKEISTTLNAEQQNAVNVAISAKDFAVVHGPPGTGKTHTIIAYILAEAMRGNRLLVVAPSNVAVDTIAERLANEITNYPNIRFVRAGHPARIMQSVLPYSLDAQLLRSEQVVLARDIRDEITSLEERVGKISCRGERDGVRREIRTLRKEMRRREKLAVRRLLAGVDVVLTTISGAGARVLDIAENAEPFDVVIIDEAAQAIEAACWVALLRARKAVLAGDPFQLSGTVKSAEAEKGGLKKSILDRVFETPSLKEGVVMLERQYRMNTVISRWTSEEFYEGRLVADCAVADRRVCDLESYRVGGENDYQNLANSFVLIDTSGGDCEEDDLLMDTGHDSTVRSSRAATASRSNKAEAQILCRAVEEFVDCGVRNQDIAVISPYSGQVELLRQSLWPKHGRTLEVSTIDSFQGREKEVVCMSLVRSNEQGEVGFLVDDRRMNVAITRARRCVVIVCDSETVSTHPLLARVIEYAEQFGQYRSAVVDFPDIVGTFSAQRRPKEAIDAEERSKNAAGRKSRKRSVVEQVPHRVMECSEALKTSASSHGSDEAIQLRIEIESVLEDSSFTERKFSPDLSTYGRRIIHELAEEFGLGHETKQAGEQRQIRIWRKAPVTRTEPDLFETTDDNDTALREPRKSENGSGTTGYDLLADNASDDESESSVREESEQTQAEEQPLRNPAQRTSENAPEDINSLQQQGVNSLIESHVSAGQSSGIGSAPSQAKNSKKKKRRGKNKNKTDSDEEFDAALAQYGDQGGTRRSNGKKDLVQKVMDGHYAPKAPPKKVNKVAQQRLAAKLSEAAKKRSRKQKEK